MKLSILVCTLPERSHYLERLMGILQPQLTDEVEVLTDERGRGLSTGQKRNDLVGKAIGEWVVFIDDDDIVPSYYVREILKATNANPDTITFKGFMTTNGYNRKDFVLMLGENYEERNGKYYRFPNHITPMRRSLAKMVQFPNITIGEDYAWAKQINDLRLIKTEFHINKDMYHYDYKTQK